MKKPDQSRHVSCARPCHFFIYIKYFCWSHQNPLLNHRNPQPCESTKRAKQCRGRGIKCHQNLRRSQENQQEWIQVNKYHTYRTKRLCIFIVPKYSTDYKYMLLTFLPPQGERAGRDSQLTSTFRAGRHHGGRLVQDRLLHGGERLEDGVELVH